MTAHPDADVGGPTGSPPTRSARRLYVGAGQYGISIYGWQHGNDGGFAERHPELKTSKGTIRLRPQDAAAIADDELLGLVGAALEP